MLEFRATPPPPKAPETQPRRQANRCEETLEGRTDRCRRDARIDAKRASRLAPRRSVPFRRRLRSRHQRYERIGAEGTSGSTPRDLAHLHERLRNRRQRDDWIDIEEKRKPRNCRYVSRRNRRPHGQPTAVCPGFSLSMGKARRYETSVSVKFVTSILRRAPCEGEYLV